VTKYMHHSSICVSAGQYVERGQQIGAVGSTGQSTGPHLHFQVELNRVAVSPDQYF
jgi:murein DD-endopeptidase MepM/ murein hydrolase activator NlpD